jgi:cytochrome c oxidase subunit 3
MTGLHAVHVIVGGIFIGFVIRGIRQETVTQERFMLHENAGLYWHLVDLIWIYLFPLFYLIH